jgi:hypothetical protein
VHVPADVPYAFITESRPSTGFVVVFVSVCAVFHTSPPLLSFDMLYLLTEIGLSPGGSSTVQYTFTHKQYIERYKTINT